MKSYLIISRHMICIIRSMTQQRQYSNKINLFFLLAHGVVRSMEYFSIFLIRTAVRVQPALEGSSDDYYSTSLKRSQRPLSPRTTLYYTVQPALPGEIPILFPAVAALFIGSTSVLAAVAPHDENTTAVRYHGMYILLCTCNHIRDKTAGSLYCMISRD